MMSSHPDIQRDFIVKAFEDMVPHFSDSDPEHPDGTRTHDYASIWEELCSLFVEAGLAEGYWPSSWCEADDPRIGYMQPPVYRQIVDPQDTHEFLLGRSISEEITVGRVLSVWADLFSGYWPFADGVYLPADRVFVPETYPLVPFQYLHEFNVHGLYQFESIPKVEMQLQLHRHLNLSFADWKHSDSFA